MMFKQNLTFFFLVFIISFSTCKDDDAQIQETSILPYSSTEHVYGSVHSLEGKIEVVINPQTGQIEELEGAEDSAVSLSSPIGTKVLTDFEGNKRLFISASSKSSLTIQDLNTLEYTVIEIKDLDIEELITNPRFLRWGATTDEVYIMDSDGSLWSVNIPEQKVNKLFDFTLSNEHYVDNFYYIPSLNQFAIHSNTTAFGALSTQLTLIDAETAEIEDELPLPAGVGLQQHPVNKNEFFYIKAYTEEEGFRLMQVIIEEVSLAIVTKSIAALPIDNLSFYVSTIHTANQVYVTKGGQAPNTVLYSINLNTGELVKEVKLATDKSLVSLKGE